MFTPKDRRSKRPKEQTKGERRACEGQTFKGGKKRAAARSRRPRPRASGAAARGALPAMYASPRAEERACEGRVVLRPGGGERGVGGMGRDGERGKEIQRVESGGREREAEWRVGGRETERGRQAGRIG